MNQIYKFVKHDVPPLEDIRGSAAYRIYEKMKSGMKLTREEKNYITRSVNSNCFFRDSVPVMGWRFNFSPILRTYLVNQYGRWSEYKAVDATSLRAYLYGRITRIVKLAS